MSTDRRRHAEALFQQAMDLAPAERPSYLDSACGDDTGLRIEVERLLSASEDALNERFMERPEFSRFKQSAADRAQTTPQSAAAPLPRRVGPSQYTDDTARLEPSTALAGRYVISRLIGAGGNGCVYMASDLHVNGKPVAVKVMRRTAFTDLEYRHFCREMETIASLSQIPGIVRIIDSDLEAAACPYLVTEFVEGWDLDEFIRHHCPPASERVHLCAEICDTLQAMHDAEVVHRDIKPSNIRVRKTKIGDRWMPVIVDFGLALHQLQEIRPFTGPGGTLQFMSPEHGDLTRITRRSDMYSLGVVLYWMLAEAFPYEVTTGDFEQIRLGTWQPRAAPLDSVVRHLGSQGIPPDLVGIVNKAMSPRPVDRFQSAAEMAASLRAIRASPVTPGRKRSTPSLYRMRPYWRQFFGATDRLGTGFPPSPQPGSAPAPDPVSVAERRSIARAFAGEISAMIDIARLHQYIERVDDLLLKAREGHVVAFRVSITGDHFHVYRSNTARIGQLPSDLADSVARFYTFALSLVEDITRVDAPPDNVTSIARLERVKRMLAHLGDLGDRLVAELKQI